MAQIVASSHRCLQQLLQLALSPTRNIGSNVLVGACLLRHNLKSQLNRRRTECRRLEDLILQRVFLFLVVADLHR